MYALIFDLDGVGLAAVSYTHLDVYKRQVMIRMRSTIGGCGRSER